MLRIRLRSLIGALALAGLLGMLAVRAAPGSQAAPLGTPAPADDVEPYREAGGDARLPTISFIDSPGATCYRPASETGACYVQWNHLSVTATSGSYVVSMTVTIDSRMRAYHAGFFQSSMTIPGEMTAPGYRVSCGAPANGASSGWGNSYSYQIRARDTSGLTAANYGSVTCPADMSRVMLPMIQRP